MYAGANESIRFVLRTLRRRVPRMAVGVLFLSLWCVRAGSSPSLGQAANGRRGLPVPPPLAVIQMQDLSGEGWQQSGEVAGSLPVARRDFDRCLDRQGWMVDKIMPLGNGARRSELSTWTKGGRRLLLMLWEIGPGKCGFSIGEEDHLCTDDARKNPDKGRRKLAALAIQPARGKQMTTNNWRLASD